ncbi:acyl-CoA thioesterase [Acanthopleuribacter pedis]|uniref:Acyl-CoA thioesterase n=1 Tax=Acanthopleuribacter pedis TaxID=442870 RepID=A0A8J7QM95_9BACT|nr:thioesterase family protein [Acanthopleuribacter pedis]MBO1320590.1 acyl-CoA thioesterase [Acanthopleuribacter pedis]
MRDRYAFFTSVAVRWGDMDALGHVNNIQFFAYFEQARIQFFEAVGADKVWDAEQGPILASASCNFLKPIVYPIDLEVGLAVTDIRNRSFGASLAIFRKDSDEMFAEGKNGIVWVNYPAGKAINLPPVLVEGLNKFKP